MAGQLIGEESHGQREWSDNEVRHELYERDQRQERLRHSRRDRLALEVLPGALFFHAHDVVNQPHQHGHEDRDRHARRGWELEKGNDLEDVAEKASDYLKTRLELGLKKIYDGLKELKDEL